MIIYVTLVYIRRRYVRKVFYNKGRKPSPRVTWTQSTLCKKPLLSQEEGIFTKYMKSQRRYTKGISKTVLRAPRVFSRMEETRKLEDDAHRLYPLCPFDVSLQLLYFNFGMLAQAQLHLPHGGSQTSVSTHTLGCPARPSVGYLPWNKTGLRPPFRLPFTTENLPDPPPIPLPFPNSSSSEILKNEVSFFSYYGSPNRLKHFVTLLSFSVTNLSDGED